MSAKNKKVVLGFMHGFIEGNEGTLINFLSEDIRWNIVGMPVIRGKTKFMQAMEMMDLWKSTPLKGSRTSEIVRNIIAEKDFVVVESSGVNNNYSNCDIFRIRNGKIDEMTSYIVDTSLSE
jgi:predicted SnoaL-like aldol condensation-catalyzing enzyme